MANDTRPFITTTGQGKQSDPGGGWSVQEDAVHHIVGQPAGNVGTASYAAAGVYSSGETYSDDGEVVAENLVLNPSPQVDATGYTTSTLPAGSRVAGVGVDGGYGYQVTATSNSISTTAGAQFGRSTAVDIALSAGDVWTPSIYISRSNTARTYAILIRYYDVANSQVGSDVVEGAAAVSADWTTAVRLVGSELTAPSGTTHVIMRAINPGAASDPWIGTRRNMARDPETTATTEWSTAGMSSSIVSGYMRSTATGGATAAINPHLTSGSAASALGSAAANDPFVMQVKVKQTGSAQYVRLRLAYFSAASAELGSLGMSPIVQTVPAGSGDYTLTLVGVLPNNPSISRITAGVYFYSSAAAALPTAGQVNEITDFLVDVGSLAPLTTGDVVYFSGSTVEPGRTFAWTGTANASTSTRSGDSIVIDRGTTRGDLDYFDGATPDAPPTGYRWSGTEYASASEMLDLYVQYGKPSGLSKYLINNPAVFSHQENDGTPDLGKIAGRITSVSPSGASVDITQTTYLQRFVAQRDIPAVSSGIALGSVDLALQLVSPTWACTLPTSGVFWTLLGHDAGFDSTNTLTTGEDEGIPVAINDTVSLLNYIEYWPRVVDNANVRVWSDPWGDGAAEATQVLGSSPYPVVGEAHLAMWVADLGTTGSSSVFINAGPENLAIGTGMSASVAVNGTSDTIEIDGTYNPGGVPTPFTVSASIAALDTSLPLQVAVAYGWTDDTHWRIRAWVVNGDGFSTSGTPVVVTTGSMGSNLDKYAEPLSFSGTGPMRYLYQERLSSAILTDTSVADDYLVEYVDPDTVFEYEYDALGDYDMGYEPIANFQGNVWDYLCEVLSLFRRNIRVDHTDGLGLVCELNQTADDVIQFDDAENQPTLQVSTDGIGRNIDYALYSTENIVDDVIYDAFLTGEIWSVEAGETKDIRIATEYTVTMAKNPRPAYYNVDYESFSTVYGSYIVSGSDNLPVQDFEWVSYGGQVLVTEVGVGYINLRLVGPPGGIPGVPGPYSLSISDGSTSYPRLTLLGSGVRASKQTVRRGTGADPQITAVELATTIDNPAISSYARLYTAHYRASKIASGPRVQLTATLPRQAFETQKFGLFQGSTFIYEDTRWRVIGGNVSELGYAFTAMPVTDMADLATKWSGYTQGDFDTYWDGWQMKDFQLSPLR